MTYHIYHIPGKKIGVTCDLEERVTKQQGYEPNEYEVLGTTKDIEIGTYFHFAHNLHIYSDKLGL